MAMNKAQVFAAALGGMGVLHFAARDAFESIVPPQLPGHSRLYNYASGLWELATAGLLWRKDTRRAGAASAYALLLAVWPANFYHAWKERSGSVPKRCYHVVRLPLQIPMLQLARRIYQAN